MNYRFLFDDTRLQHAGQLVARLGSLHLQVLGAEAAEDLPTARRDTLTVEDLLQHAELQVLRAAVVIATEPHVGRPVPVVPGPADVAAVVGLDEILAMLGAYAHACMAVGAGQPAAKREAEQAYKPLRKALEAQFGNALAYELARARDGRS